MATEPTIDYEKLQRDAMRGVVRSVLQRIVEHGLPGEHHFYVSFLTQAPGVILSKRLKEKYPQEMTIVLQHRFWDLIVSDERFEVKLTFDGIPERLVVPFAAIKVFIDPSVRFGLQFDETERDDQALQGLNTDTSFDQVGEARGDASRTSLPKKPRAARKPRVDKDPAGATKLPAARGNEAARTQPEPPQPETVAGAAGAAANEKPGAEAGAKILSLDQFRKK